MEEAEPVWKVEKRGGAKCQSAQRIARFQASELPL